VLAQYCLDLSWLDAKAPDLDLVVEAAQVLDVTVREITGQVLSLVEACSRLVT
jgi:hypothetical protein